MKAWLKLLLGISKAEKPAKLNLSNIKGVVQAFTRQLQGFDVNKHIYEQVLWRRTQIMWNSPKCWYSGTCKICGCSILEKTIEDRACSISEHPDLLKHRNPCYPAMMTEAEWEQFKKVKNVKLFL